MTSHNLTGMFIQKQAVSLQIYINTTYLKIIIDNTW